MRKGVVEWSQGASGAVKRKTGGGGNEGKKLQKNKQKVGRADPANQT